MAVSPLIAGSPYLDEKDKVAEAGKVANVDAKLILTGSLTAPIINLDFDVKQQGIQDVSSSAVANAINIIKNNEEERYKQVVSILLFRAFTPVNSGILTGNSVGNTINSGVGELVSNQVNYWLSQISNDVQFGFDYVHQEAFVLRLSTTIRDKVAVNGSYDLTTNNHNVSLSVPISKHMRASTFSRGLNNTQLNTTGYVVGVGLSWKKSFEKVSDLFFWKKNARKKAASPVKSPKDDGIHATGSKTIPRKDGDPKFTEKVGPKK